jgi:N-acetylmuramoyl-L-alanine amidase
MHHRLQITLVFVAPVLLLAGLYAIGHALGVRAPLLGRGYVIRVELPDADAGIGLPPIAGPQDPSRPLVVIDAGHGGHDPGASGGDELGGLKEKTLTLALARALRDELVREGGVRVALTREDDRFLVLDERAEIARALGADLFLSIHADSAGEKDQIAGASVYTLSAKASSQAAERFAARENSADMVNGVRLADQDDNVNAILVELSQRRTQEQSDEFASLILREGQGVLAFHPQAQRTAALVVLRAPDVPSVLFEAGFISNPDEAGRLASPEGQRHFAEAMARAIRVYFARQAGT